MKEAQMPDPCSDEMLMDAIEMAGRDEPAALARLAALIVDHPADPRLHFLEGSLLAGLGRFDEGRAAMGRAVALAPDYAIARFQLGLLELSSGDAVAADATLRPLAEGDPENGLALFARGLRHLARDELGPAADLLRSGIERNLEHPLVNRDMELMIAGIEAARSAPDQPADEVSAAHLLLRLHSDKGTRH
jgi:tetratricopeptide (TPR) repeat protein